jgi:hypothetical protein
MVANVKVEIVGVWVGLNWLRMATSGRLSWIRL